MSNKIELISINELIGMSFFIPNYQRGYRWTTQQVKDLLNDIQEFIDRGKPGFYCIQPLVVKRNIPKSKLDNFKLGLERVKDSNVVDTLVEDTEKLIFENVQWEVIDGQQRLTTIFILLSHLKRQNAEKYIPLYSIEYETRNDSKEFLSNITVDKLEENIDYYHIVKANQQIETWFSNSKSNREEYFETLLKNVKFIWYESIDENPIEVFKRLNIGKISLTNSELIKALFLNKSNFADSDYQKIRLQQQEIASDWDQIEFTLQNDEFWLFLSEKGYNKPTRIDFIFDLICDKNQLGIDAKELNEIGSDEYRTFRYFYRWFKQNKSNDIIQYWKEVKKYFQIFQEWFNDLELYHYVGFLIEQKIKVRTIIDEWMKPNMSKSEFIKSYIVSEIKKKIAGCADLNKQYEVSSNPKKNCRPILLLHNVQTVINQNKTLQENEKYNLPVFYKFPFHLFKKEQWDVEHIDSNIENALEKNEEKKEWLRASYIGINDEGIENEIRSFLKKGEPETDQFEAITRKINGVHKIDKLNGDDKNKLWNFTLLDSSTNRSYGNSIFPAKRRVIIGKDQGKKITVDDDLKIVEENGAIAFIPPCTKNVFLKYYNASTNNLKEWDKNDAQAYLSNIETTLDIFLN